MKKKSTPKQRLLTNLNNMIPFIGFMLVIAGILGLLFVQTPLQLSQDPRSDASEGMVYKLPTLTPQNENQEFSVDEDSTISLVLNTDGEQISEVVTIFNILNTSIGQPQVFINVGSGLAEKSIEIQQTSDGYLVQVIAIPSNVNFIVAPHDTSFIKIKFIPTQVGTISINLDEENSILYPKHGQGFNITADLMEFKITSDEPVVCTQDVQACPDGTFVGRVAPNCDFESCPGLSQCDESCSSSSNCEVGHRCYNGSCRLATNVSSSTCEKLINEPVTYQQCNQSCGNSRDCQAGLTCWDENCRNPNNVDNSSCANLTTIQETASIESCGGSCDSNADCAINLRCYNNECRLASNPSSTSCSAATVATVSTIYDQPTSDTPEDDSDPQTPIKKGDNIIPAVKIKLDPIENKEPSNTEYSELNNADYGDESLLDLLRSMLLDKQQALPIAVISLGIILLILSILAFVFKKAKRKTKPPQTGNSKKIDVETHDVKPGMKPNKQAKTAQSEAVKNMTKQLEEESKKQN